MLNTFTHSISKGHHHVIRFRIKLQPIVVLARNTACAENSAILRHIKQCLAHSISRDFFRIDLLLKSHRCPNGTRCMAQPSIHITRKATDVVVQARIRVHDHRCSPSQIPVLQPPIGQPVLRGAGALLQFRMQSGAFAVCGREIGAQPLRMLQFVGAE